MTFYQLRGSRPVKSNLKIMNLKICKEVCDHDSYCGIIKELSYRNRGKPCGTSLMIADNLVDIPLIYISNIILECHRYIILFDNVTSNQRICIHFSVTLQATQPFCRNNNVKEIFKFTTVSWAGVTEENPYYSGF
jgi:hypothetical protein